MANDPLEIWHLFNLPDGKSSVERLKIGMDEGPRGASKRFSGPGVTFNRLPAGTFLDWHPGPRRQLTVLIQGEVETEFGDGQKRTAKPGSVTLVEDLAGSGHTTRSIGPDDAVFVFIHLDADTKVG